MADNATPPVVYVVPEEGTGLLGTENPISLEWAAP